MPDAVGRLLGTRFRLRITATALLSENGSDAKRQRAVLRREMERLSRVAAGVGVSVEFVVGAPRSPELLRASLVELVGEAAEAAV